MEETSQENQENNMPKSKNSMLIGGVAFTVIIIGAVVLLGNKKTVNQTSTAATPTQSQIEEESESGAEKMVEGANITSGPISPVENNNAEAKVITIEAGSYYYNPKEIRVKKGDVVQIVMTAKDMMHDFNIDELGVKIPITKSGETNSVTFVASKTGEFEYYCSVGNHRKLGQTGTFTVEE